MAVKLEQPDLAQHHAENMAQLHKFWKESQLCDVTLRSRDGIEHRAHIAVLSASSSYFKAFAEWIFARRDQVQQGQPVEIAASDAVVSALLWLADAFGSVQLWTRRRWPLRSKSCKKHKDCMV